MKLNSIKTSQSVLGEVLNANLTVKIFDLSSQLNSIIEIISKPGKHPKLRSKFIMPEKTEFEKTVVFNSNRYGYYLPIHPEIEEIELN